MKVINGTNHVDYINVSSSEKPFQINGLSGNDNIIGSDFDDIIYGGKGNDFLYGNNGVDIIYGGEGNDVIYPGTGANYISAGPGDDTIYTGEAYADIINLGDGNDKVVITNKFAQQTNADIKTINSIDEGVVLFSSPITILTNHEPELVAKDTNSIEARIFIGDFKPGEDKIDLQSFKLNNFEDINFNNDNGFLGNLFNNSLFTVNKTTSFDLTEGYVTYHVILDNVDINEINESDFIV